MGVKSVEWDGADEKPLVEKHSDEKYTSYSLVGGLVAIFYFPIYWECHHPN